MSKEKRPTLVKIKLRVEPAEIISFESVWVRKVTHNIGEICNLPLFAENYKYKDLIEFDPETREALDVIKDGGYYPTELKRYKGTFSAAKTKWETKGYIVEGFAPGILGLSVRHE
ncbi:MAG: hypothetical protein COT21_01155 [Hadesarchaea archaeon CG08_land_8_20_14_0_20_51_8]|nr:MAG: hypothetical protein COT21_01155 [Hadesarchaea archaeon CG08_land_8_20_14_0_20_51_8]